MFIYKYSDGYHDDVPILLPRRAASGSYLRRKLQREHWARIDYDPALPEHLQSETYHANMRRLREERQR